MKKQIIIVEIGNKQFQDKSKPKSISIVKSLPENFIDELNKIKLEMDKFLNKKYVKRNKNKNYRCK